MTDRAKSGEPKKREERTDATEDRKPLPLDAASRMKARVVLAVLLVVLALWTAASFMPALIWATILAVSLWPLYVEFAKRFASGPSTLAAFIFTLIVALILFTPMALAVYQVAHQGDVLIGWLKKAGESGIEVPDDELAAVDELVKDADTYSKAARAAVICGLRHA
jgi:predicted PurR-regulated permease PerM